MIENHEFVQKIFLGFAIGFVVTTLIVAVIFGGVLCRSQYLYTRCVSDGAPAQLCAETYLLPEKN